jgi:hypothetical protein
MGIDSTVERESAARLGKAAVSRPRSQISKLSPPRATPRSAADFTYYHSCVHDRTFLTKNIAGKVVVGSSTH